MKSRFHRSIFGRMTPLPLAAAAATLSVLAAAGTASASVAGLAAGHLARQHVAARPAATTLKWHQLGLKNGWVSGRSASLNIANPAYTISGGVVYLDGGLHQPGGGNVNFAVLPRGYRPAHTLYMPVYGDGTAGTLRVDTNGDLNAYGGNTITFTSLTGISFPVSGMSWHRLRLSATWGADPTTGTGPPSYAVRNGIVHLAGAVEQQRGGVTFGYLPKGARPSRTLYIAVYTYGGVVGSVRIRPDGAMSAHGPQTVNMTSLAGISFPSGRLAWKKLPLENAWASANGTYSTGDPAYAVVGPIVYLSGSMREASSASRQFASMPAAIRPSHDLIMLTYTYGYSYGTLTFTRSVMGTDSNPVSNSELYTSLAAISYPRSS